ncbi:MAG: DsbA family protein [Halobacteriales archaeon]|nr:DsbA family protein [Halobacteriales archaeon]
MADESRIEKKKKEKQKGGGEDGSEFWSYAALVGIIGVIVVISYFVFFSGGAAAEVESWDDIKAIQGDDPTMVSADADANETDGMVEVVYYGDFACGHCVNFERNSFDTLKDEYIATGDVRFVFRPLDFQAQNDPDSRRGALAAPAVWENNRDAYWTWHRTMFANYDARANWATPDQIGSFASDAGADGDSIAQSVSQGEYANDIAEHRSQAQTDGVTGTPSFIVNGTVVQGGNYEQLSSQIDSELEG